MQSKAQMVLTALVQCHYAAVLLHAADLYAASSKKKTLSLAEAIRDDERLQHMTLAEILNEFRPKVCM